uniref:NAD/NADP octopine/nopaline dehydrogenase family protein n=1 Tax=uncultured Allobacillus sp. TaxID=1638025 RepID=UPI0025952FCC|nr:NAD/NADP octopine/nopaline dehydrogenase family protein [uncultured Allobacillus sp.]
MDHKEKGIHFNNEWVFPKQVTSDIEEALFASSLVLITESVNHVEHLAEMCAPCLTDNHRIVFLGNGSLASIRWTHRLKELGVEANILVGETHLPPYETKLNEDTLEVELLLRSKKLLFSTFPTTGDDEFFRGMRSVYPSIEKATNSWEVLLNNLLPETAVVPLLSNLAKFDQDDVHFHVYPDGLSPSVVNVIQEVDQERQKICRALGLEAKNLERRLVETGYARPLDELIEQLKKSDVLKEKSIIPSELSTQLLEGLHFAIVPWVELANMLELETPTLTALLHIGSVSLDRLLVQEGLTLDKIGFFNETAYSLTTAVQATANRENDEETDEPQLLQ